MEQKYLPIGSVCTLKGKNKKVMIIGYYSVKFNGNLKINDYYGCVYPEGLLLPEQTCTFNHSDIEFVDFIGYKNEEYNKFKNLLYRLTVSEEENIESAEQFHKHNDMFLTSNSTYSKLLFDENGVVMIAEPLEKSNDEKNFESLKNLKLDENGPVISMETEEVKNPFYNVFETNEESKEKNNDNKTWKIFNKIEFDENGTVISAEENPSDTLSKIEFDENGTVISVNGETLKEAPNKSVSRYAFDENGTIVSEETYTFDENGTVVSVKNNEMEPVSNTEEAPNKSVSRYAFDENGTIVSEETYTFDENGTVVSVKNNEMESAPNTEDALNN